LGRHANSGSQATACAVTCRHRCSDSWCSAPWLSMQRTLAGAYHVPAASQVRTMYRNLPGAYHTAAPWSPALLPTLQCPLVSRGWPLGAARAHNPTPTPPTPHPRGAVRPDEQQRRQVLQRRKRVGGRPSRRPQRAPAVRTLRRVRAIVRLLQRHAGRRELAQEAVLRRAQRGGPRRQACAAVQEGQVGPHAGQVVATPAAAAGRGAGPVKAGAGGCPINAAMACKCVCVGGWLSRCGCSLIKWDGGPGSAAPTRTAGRWPSQHGYT
jgi:hypothetical protein